MTSRRAPGSVRPDARGPSERSTISMFDAARPPTIMPSFGDRQRWFVCSVATVGNNEMDCTAALALLSRIAETRHRSQMDKSSLSDVYLHIRHCRHCADVFHTLLALVDMEDAGSLPDVDSLLHEVRQVAAATPHGRSAATGSPGS